MRCPCRKKTETTAYAACCAPYHEGTHVPVTAEALMRSRYTAFALNKADYLRATWHASTRPAHVGFVPEQEWLSLKIEATATEGNTATVTFTARSRIGGASHVLREVSRFVREGGRWYYLDGMIGA